LKAIPPLLLILLILISGSGIFAQQQDDPCPLPDNKKARKLYQEAIDKVRSNRNEARGLLRQALEIEPDFGRANFMMGDILLKSERVKEAEPFLRLAAEQCPELNFTIYFKLGSIAFGEKQYAESMSYLEKFIASNEGKENERSEAREMLTACKFFMEGFAHPVPFNPNPLNHVCTDADEYLPIITADNEKLYFTRRIYQITRAAYGEEKKQIEKFSVAQASSENQFGKGAPLPYPFNQSGNEGGASLTADNKYMYFTICKQNGPNLNCDIYYSVFSKDEWSEIRSLGPSVNGPDSWDSQPSVSADGKTIYFASNRPGGLGELDIWKTTRNSDGTWTTPENLGPDINTPGSEKSPFFHSDGQTLYFSSTGLMGFGGYDIFMSKLEENGKWKNPKNLGYPINSEMDDLGFFVSTDGKTGYFASDKLKGAGGWDIYAFELYKEARPERVFFFSGELKDENNNTVTEARVEIKNVKTKEITTIDVDSLTGKYVAVMAFNEDHILTVKQAGKAFTSQYLSKSDSSLNKPKKIDLEVREIKVGTPYKINNIHFETNSYDLTEQTIYIVKELALFLEENASVKIAIHGHTDNVGDLKNNLLLSENRAKKVFSILTESGIDPARLSAKGFGASKPVASNNTESGRALNRRTEFVITDK
jgi:outer membrane protein OmpA-like peptidoglycan-associated protein/tetratricopeptide (TPR) repeat protein